ncbi:deoxyribose-phosphate aldolase [Oxobacter pfennigii]|uniref:Deoxyribose-phosphate aldolase n=1 Tax=Oxobacter pfennigii TaxID=36849 RepID=A0A0P8YWF4_9CLOT|nr:deoxyribose-phosphate aldolase [Oxobacter pfennigii]KPU44051.1 deoxyribose-phosphate aldolase [Oxobacter pfennigii]
MDKKTIASMIDHTLLKPQATIKDVEKLCSEATDFGFSSVCINPYFVKAAAKKLSGSSVSVCTVIGFPLGANTTETKIFEAKKAVEEGAVEVDMVINIGALKNKEYDYVRDDINGVVEAVRDKAIVKVIIETCLLDDDEKVKVCKIAMDAGAHFVKTSTGFGIKGATIHDVELMREAVGEHLGVKASGGIKTYEDAVNMINAGATRLGTSSSIKIIE